MQRVVQRYDDGEVEVSAIDPATTMQTVGNPALSGIAGEVRDGLNA